MDKKFSLGIIGAGNMASAIVNGILKAGLLTPSQMEISDPDENKLGPFKVLGLNTVTENRDLASSCEYLLFAVKPQIAPAVFDQIKDCIGAHTVVSIMAGISISKMKSYLGQRNYARVMPNTPAMVGEGMAAVAFSENFRSKFVLDIFRSIGKAIELDESLFDAVTSVSGSGPAYVYLFMKAMIDGGVEGGLDYDTAKALTQQTFIGAVKMVESESGAIDDLICAVCSKGGTTIQAIDAFKSAEIEEIIKNGMRRCKRRSEELGKQ